MQTRLRTRAFVAMCGTFGFELDISTATPKDLLGENDVEFVAHMFVFSVNSCA